MLFAKIISVEFTLAWRPRSLSDPNIVSCGEWWKLLRIAIPSEDGEDR